MTIQQQESTRWTYLERLEWRTMSLLAKSLVLAVVPSWHLEKIASLVGLEGENATPFLDFVRRARRGVVAEERRRRRAVIAAHREPESTQRPLCFECRNGNHSSPHSQMGCLSRVDLGFVCGCALPGEFSPKPALTEFEFARCLICDSRLRATSELSEDGLCHDQCSRDFMQDNRHGLRRIWTRENARLDEAKRPIAI